MAIKSQSSKLELDQATVYDSLFSDLGIFIARHERKPNPHSDSSRERTLSNFMYKISSSGTMQQKERLASVLGRHGLIIKNFKSSDELLDELEAFMIRNQRFPRSSGSDKEHMLYDFARRTFRSSDKEKVSRLEEMVILYDWANTCTFFAGGEIPDPVVVTPNRDKLKKEFFSTVLVQDIATGNIKLDGISAHYDPVTRAGGRILGCYVLSKKGLPDVIVPLNGLYLVNDVKESYFASVDESGKLSKIGPGHELFYKDEFSTVDYLFLDYKTVLDLLDKQGGFCSVKENFDKRFGGTISTIRSGAFEGEPVFYFDFFDRIRQVPKDGLFLVQLTHGRYEHDGFSVLSRAQFEALYNVVDNGKAIKKVKPKSLHREPNNKVHLKKV